MVPQPREIGRCQDSFGFLRVLSPKLDLVQGIADLARATDLIHWEKLALVQYVSISRPPFARWQPTTATL